MQQKAIADSDSVINILDNTVDKIGEIILGKHHEIRLAFACLLAKGHLLIEDLPGVGKTTLAHTLAKALGLEFQRIQFTSDLLPADILGVSVYQRESGDFKFHSGPIFSQIILADEINRATPKTQSALLEAMEERQVTIEGETRQLPNPFFVIATQNPTYQVGTFPLPESQLDRFAMKISLGYLDADAERILLKGDDPRILLQTLQSNITIDDLLNLQNNVLKIHVSDALLDYLQKILEFTRSSSLFQIGLSPRAGLTIKRIAQAWAMLNHRQHVLPEDIQSILIPTVIHRLRNSDHETLLESTLQEKLIKAIPIS